MLPEIQRRSATVPNAAHLWGSRQRTPTKRETWAVRQASDPIARPTVLQASSFESALVRERKRIERSDRSFALLLLSVKPDVGLDPLLMWESISQSLAAVGRDTDILGWFQHGQAMGLILTELVSAEVMAASGIDIRIRRELSRRLSRSALSAVSIRLYAASDIKGSFGDFEVTARQTHARAHRLAKRALDVAGSLALLALFSPLFVLLAALVKISSRGPVLFKQNRIGEQGKPFQMLKFRTMFTGADQALHQEFVTRFITSTAEAADAPKSAPYKIANDPRVTPLGRLLRKTSLDELPQFWNVLRGDMSLVGPRPPLDYELERYKRWHCRRVLEAKPGITGPWQVKGRSRTTFDEMVRMDLRYARSTSVWTDLKILLATPAAVLSGKGAA